MKKTLFLFVLLVSMLSYPCMANSESEIITVVLDGQAMEFDTTPLLMNDRTMVPLRALFEAMDAQVQFQDDLIMVTKADSLLVLGIGLDYAIVNGQQVSLDAPPILVNSRTLVPVRFVSEQLGLTVDWEESERCVYLTTVQTETTSQNAPQETIQVQMEVAGYGTILLELYPQYAPTTVANFVSLVKDGFYNGLTFHRIISGFMIQGGDPLGTGMGGSSEQIFGEFSANGFAQNTLKHTRGVISMARSNDPNSASSQFFIMHQDAPHLDGLYAAFGMVTQGMEVVDQIAQAKTDEMDKPLTPIVISSIQLVN